MLCFFTLVFGTEIAKIQKEMEQIQDPQSTPNPPIKRDIEWCLTELKKRITPENKNALQTRLGALLKTTLGAFRALTPGEYTMPVIDAYCNLLSKVTNLASVKFGMDTEEENGKITSIYEARFSSLNTDQTPPPPNTIIELPRKRTIDILPSIIVVR